MVKKKKECVPVKVEDIEEDVNPLSEKQKNDLLFDLICYADIAHKIIEATINGERINANLLENYYHCVNCILTTADEQGSLFGSVIDCLDDRIMEQKA